jgi:uncharacterized protein YjbI with pentapeptide repeats
VIPNLAGIALKLSERQMAPINGGPINLAYAQLKGAFLRFADLSAANLEAADLADADFSHPRLNHANLSYANLSNACLDHADLTAAKLLKADLSGANLQHARNLTQRQLYGTIGSASTILPPDIQRPASWAELTREPLSDNPEGKTNRQAQIRKKLSWMVGALLCAIGLVLAGVVWMRSTSSISAGSIAQSSPRLHVWAELFP